MRYFVEYALVQEGAICWGVEEYVGEDKSLEACAATCRGVSDMFIHAMDNGACYCETFTKNRRCRKQVRNLSGYNLYSLQSPSKESLTFFTHIELYSYCYGINSCGTLFL